MPGLTPYTGTIDIHAANGQEIAAFQTGTFPGSASLAFVNVSAVSVSVSSISILGTNTSNFTVSTNAVLPITIANVANAGSLPFNIVFTNARCPTGTGSANAGESVQMRQKDWRSVSRHTLPYAGFVAIPAG